jgi:hypothetical protein
LDEDGLQPRNKIISIQIIGEDFPAFDATTNYVVERTRSVNASLAGHILSSSSLVDATYILMGVPLVFPESFPAVPVWNEVVNWLTMAAIGGYGAWRIRNK